MKSKKYIKFVRTMRAIVQRSLFFLFILKGLFVDSECLFCEIYKDKTDIVFENDSFYGRFDRFPVAPGHGLVIPKRHVVSYLELTENEQRDMLPAIKGMIRIIESVDREELYGKIFDNPINEKMKAFLQKMLSHVSLNKEPDGYNIGVNEGIPAGRTIHHVHIQVIPRYIGDVEDFVGGIRHVIPGMGNYK